MNKQEVITLLKEGTVVLEFEKADGSMRKMTATLKEEWLPEVKQNSNSKPKNSDVLAVYEITSGWKSFRWDRLHRVETEEYENNSTMPLDVDVDFWKNRM